MLKAESISRGSVLPIKINTSTFPGGEVHIAVDDGFDGRIPQLVRITAHLRSPADQMEGGALEVVFRDGNLKRRDTFSAIRKRLGAL